MVTRWTYLGLALLAVGLLTAGAGAATHVDEEQCRSTQYVSVAPANDTTTAAANVTAYEELAPGGRAIFRRALAVEGGLLTGRGAIDPGTVAYENRTYVVRVARDRGCEPYHPRRVLAPTVGGLALVVAGLALARGRRG